MGMEAEKIGDTGELYDMALKILDDLPDSFVADMPSLLSTVAGRKTVARALGGTCGVSRHMRGVLITIYRDILK